MVKSSALWPGSMRMTSPTGGLTDTTPPSRPLVLEGHVVGRCSTRSTFDIVRGQVVKLPAVAQFLKCFGGWCGCFHYHGAYPLACCDGYWVRLQGSALACDHRDAPLDRYWRVRTCSTYHHAPLAVLRPSPRSQRGARPQDPPSRQTVLVSLCSERVGLAIRKRGRWGNERRCRLGVRCWHR